MLSARPLDSPWRPRCIAKHHYVALTPKMKKKGREGGGRFHIDRQTKFSVLVLVQLYFCGSIVSRFQSIDRFKMFILVCGAIVFRFQSIDRLKVF